MEYLLSGFAVTIAVFSLYVASRTDKVQRLAQVHQMLHEVDSQRGRRLLYEITPDDARWEKLRESRGEEWDLINRMLSILDLVGFYRAQRWLPRSRNTRKDPVLMLWGLVLTRMEPFARKFIGYRLESEGVPGSSFAGEWPYLDQLFKDARAWKAAA